MLLPVRVNELKVTDLDALRALETDAYLAALRKEQSPVLNRFYLKYVLGLLLAGLERDVCGMLSDVAIRSSVQMTPINSIQAALASREWDQVIAVTQLDWPQDQRSTIHEFVAAWREQEADRLAATFFEIPVDMAHKILGSENTALLLSSRGYVLRDGAFVLGQNKANDKFATSSRSSILFDAATVLNTPPPTAQRFSTQTPGSPNPRLMGSIQAKGLLDTP